MKLAACYSVFNSCELLHNSIKQIIDQVDVVIVCWQQYSNVGNLMSVADETYLEIVATIDKVHLLEYTPDLSLNPKENERRKLQGRIDYAKTLGCTHYFGAAADHYYKKQEFIYAKAECLVHDYDVTLTHMYTYYKEPTYQLEPIEDYCCPFICKIYPDTKVVQANHYPETVDPSVRIAPAKLFHTFKQDEIMLHHFSMVRHDIKSKFENAAAAQNWKHKIPAFLEEYNNAKPGDQITYFKGRKIKEVGNHFDIK